MATTFGGTPVAINIKGLYAAYQRQPVLEDINLQFPAGKWTAIVGPNGAGKSTLFHVLTGSMKALRGSVQAFNEPIATHRKAGHIAYMAQREAIEWDFPVSVWETVMGGRYGHMRSDPLWRRLLPSRWYHSRHVEAVREALLAVDMLALAERPIGALSGGQKKRVLLARTLAQQANILLLDEPLAGVDPPSERLILGVLAREREAGRTVIMVTHDMPGARRHVDHVVLINRFIRGVGSPDEMLSDAKLAELAVSSIEQSANDVRVAESTSFMAAQG
ncbi:MULTISPECIES: metal ABC transporter ATP-binding protein [unclassified Halomonas]|uniref:metal ABC transporter ATP-binding protein n=1 Tax=unclassified Halomonas TaxID=2609666 RepID=UPI001CF30C93|nr:MULTISPECIES: metal ABC transporter ATP-binding protein [unclassified Halomonas]MCA8864702.1 metal ABC transporter ATP-binding protein [Halomonas sp. SBBP1]UZH11939.1 metal ABC transporter ATP-binding protein [Halomonas sp. BDJS001]